MDKSAGAGVDSGEYGWVDAPTSDGRTCRIPIEAPLMTEGEAITSLLMDLAEVHLAGREASPSRHLGLAALDHVERFLDRLGYGALTAPLTSLKVALHQLDDGIVDPMLKPARGSKETPMGTLQFRAMCCQVFELLRRAEDPKSGAWKKRAAGRASQMLRSQLGAIAPSASEIVKWRERLTDGGATHQKDAAKAVYDALRKAVDGLPSGTDFQATARDLANSIRPPA